MGARVRAARLYRRMTMVNVTERMGLAKGQQWLNRVELGRVPNITLVMIQRLAEALRVDPGWLAFGECTGKGPAAIEVMLAEIAFRPRAKGEKPGPVPLPFIPMKKMTQG